MRSKLIIYCMMKILIISIISSLWLIFLVGASVAAPITVKKPQKFTCLTRRSRCFLKTITCPTQCPTTNPTDPKSKACYVNCDSPICKAECRNRKPNCNGRGAACYDPRFIGGDGIVFYFHGKAYEHFSLVSDHNLQINARFIGLRPAGRTRDYTWIQALGVRFGSHNLSIHATRAATWDDKTDHLELAYDGNKVVLPQEPLSVWMSQGGEKIRAERISGKNDVIVSIQDAVEIGINVVPVTREDDRIHNYHIPSDDCFAHLEVQFRFLGLSSQVEGVLGRTYRPDFENPAKPGAQMPVVGGEDKYRTTSLLSTDCRYCMFSPDNNDSLYENPRMMVTE